MGCTQSQSQSSPTLPNDDDRRDSTMDVQIDESRFHDFSSITGRQHASSSASSSSSSSRMATTDRSLQSGSSISKNQRRLMWPRKLTSLSFQKKTDNTLAGEFADGVNAVNGSTSSQQRQSDDLFLQVGSIDEDRRPHCYSSLPLNLNIDVIDNKHQEHQSDTTPMMNAWKVRRKSMGSSDSEIRSFHNFYLMGNEIGCGSFGCVRLCIDKRTQQQFAVKIMEKTTSQKNVTNNDSNRYQSREVNLTAMFYNEVSILATLKHPNIVSLIDVFEGPTSLYAVLELLDSGDLFHFILKHTKLQRDLYRKNKQQLLENNTNDSTNNNNQTSSSSSSGSSNSHHHHHPIESSLSLSSTNYDNNAHLLYGQHQLNERQLILITRTIMEILKHLHEQRIVHRDVKAQNFLFTSSRQQQKGVDKSIATSTATTIDEQSSSVHPSGAVELSTRDDNGAISPPTTSSASSSSSSVRGRSSSNISVVSTEATNTNGSTFIVGSSNQQLSKSQSILICGNTLKLIDCGMSIFLPEDQHLTTLCGSPHYVAPEVIGQHYGFEADVFAAGVVVYLMIYGNYPFNGPSRKDILAKIRQCQPAFPSDGLNPSNLAIDFLSRCFTRDPSKRMTAVQALEHPWLQDHYYDSLLRSEKKSCSYPLVHLTHSLLINE